VAAVALLIALLPGASDADVLAAAEAAFRAGLQARDNTAEARNHFREAGGLYEELRRRGYRDAALYRNEGNAYLLAGDLPRALLAYRRGLRGAPNDRLLRANLAYAREQVAYPEPGAFARPPVDHWPPWLSRPAPALLLASSALLYALAWLALTRWWMTREGRLLTAGLVLLLVAAGPAGLLVVEAHRERAAELHPLVVVAADGVPLRKGNGMAYPPRYDTRLNRGVEGRLLFARGDWLQIELAGGETGWVPRRQVLVDEP